MEVIHSNRSLKARKLIQFSIIILIKISKGINDVASNYSWNACNYQSNKELWRESPKTLSLCICFSWSESEIIIIIHLTNCPMIHTEYFISSATACTAQWIDKFFTISWIYRSLMNHLISNVFTINPG